MQLCGLLALLPTEPVSEKATKRRPQNLSVLYQSEMMLASCNHPPSKNQSKIEVENFNSYQLRKHPETESWLVRKPILHLHLHSEKKCVSSSERLEIDFLQFLMTIPEYTYISTDGLKYSTGTASAAVMGVKQRTARLPNCASIFSAEIHAILLALRLIANSKNTKFMIFSDSL